MFTLLFFYTNEVLQVPGALLQKGHKSTIKEVQMNMYMTQIAYFYCVFLSFLEPESPWTLYVFFEKKDILKSKYHLLWSVKERRSVILVWKDMRVSELSMWNNMFISHCWLRIGNVFVMPIAKEEKMSNGALPWILKDANGLLTGAVQCRIPKYGDEALYLVLSPRGWRADFGREGERERERGKTTYW